MALRKMQDSQTGATIKFDWQGEGEPTEQDLHNIAQDYYAQQKAPAEAAAPTPSPSITEDPVGYAWDTVKNVPSSAFNVGKGIYDVVRHPVDTLTGLGNLALGTAQLAIPGEQGKEAYPKAVGQYVSDRYGGLSNVANTFRDDPVGTMADLSTFLTLGGGLAKQATRLPALSRYAGVADTVMDIGSKIDPILGTVRGVQGIAGLDATKDLFGALTGTGAEAVRTGALPKTAYNGPFKQALDGKISEGDIVTRAKEGLARLKEKRNAAYESNMAAVDGANTNVDIAPIRQQFADRLSRDYNVGFVTDPATGETILDFSRSPGLINDAEKVKSIKTLLDTWGNQPGDMTVAGFDRLKRLLNVTGQDRGTAYGKFASGIYGAVKDSILSAAPKYGEAMEQYSNATSALDDITKGLSAGDKAQLDTTFKKLQSTMRENMGQRKALLDQLDDPELSQMIAGQMFNKWLPRGVVNRILAGGSAAAGSGALAASSHPVLAFIAASAMAAGSSPKLVGNFLNTLGYAKEQFAPIMTLAQKIKAAQSVTAASRAQQATSRRQQLEDYLIPQPQ